MSQEYNKYSPFISSERPFFMERSFEDRIRAIAREEILKMFPPAKPSLDGSPRPSEAPILCSACDAFHPVEVLKTSDGHWVTKIDHKTKMYS